MRLIEALAVLATVAFAAAPPANAAAPENIRNHSFTVTWNETHNQSRDGGPLRDVSVPYRWTVYFSSAGRGFGRTTSARTEAPGAMRSSAKAQNRSEAASAA